MNQGKLEVVKQKMARVNVDILGISGLKWTGMGEFLIQMTITSAALGKNLLEEMEQPSESTRVQNAVLGCNTKNDRMISVCF